MGQTVVVHIDFGLETCVAMCVLGNMKTLTRFQLIVRNRRSNGFIS